MQEERKAPSKLKEKKQDKNCRRIKIIAGGDKNTFKVDKKNCSRIKTIAGGDKNTFKVEEKTGKKTCSRIKTIAGGDKKTPSKLKKKTG